MKVLITGGTGLIGQAIAKALHDGGASVNYLTRQRGKIVSTENHKGFHWDPAQCEIDVRCFQGVDAIINLAGTSIAKRWTPSYKRKVLDSRIDSLATLQRGLEQVGATQIKSFVSASAIGIYPNSLMNFYGENEKQVDAGFLGEVTKKWENRINAFDAFPFSLAKIRIGIVLSMKGGALPKMAKPVQNFVGAAFGTGEQWQSWIHIDDLVRMFLFVVQNNLKGTFNGVAPNPVTNSKMTRQLAKVLKRPLILPNIPKFAMYAILGEMACLLFASQRVSSKRIEKKGFVFTHANIGAALQNLLAPKSSGAGSTINSLSEEYV